VLLPLFLCQKNTRTILANALKDLYGVSEKAHVEYWKRKLKESKVTRTLHLAKTASLTRVGLISSEAGVQRPVLKGSFVVFA
jgi:hypothetical protein